MIPNQRSEHYHKYVELDARRKDLEAQRDDVLDAMDDAWFKMSPEEIDLVDPEGVALRKANREKEGK